MAESDKQGAIPIYVSFSTFTTFLDWLREMNVIPDQFDSSLWRDKFSGAAGSQIMGGARFLKLLDGDRPTAQLEPLVVASTEQRKELMLEVMRAAYGAELLDGLPKMTPRVLNEKLEALGTTSSTHDKARSFFVNAAKAVGLNVPAIIAKQARNKTSSSRRKNGRSPANGTAGGADERGTGKGADSGLTPRGTPKIEHQYGDSRTVTLRDGATLTLGCSVGVMQLKGTDRAFVLQLLDAMDDFENGAGSVQPLTEDIGTNGQ